ncbi:MAG: DNRLRE domain-containing protein [Prevotella sp.]|nr:DNRLRE domain-containing protein [Prevotella sp.]
MFTFVAFTMGVNAWAEDLNLAPTGITYISAGTPDEVKYDAAATSWLANFSKISGGKLTDQLAAYGGTPITIAKFDASSLPEGATITNATLTFNSVCTVSGKNSQVAVATIGTDWDATTATWNNVDLSATFVADLAWSGGSTAQSCDVKSVLAADEDKVVAFAIYTNTGREQSISDVKLNVSYTTGTIAEYEYTVNAVDGEGDILSEIATGKCLETDEMVVYAPYAVEKDGKWYVIQAETFANPITTSGTISVAYQAKDDVVAFVDLNNDAKGDYSGGAVGHVTGTSSNMKTGAALGAVAPGKYKAVTVLSANGNRGIYIRDINSTEADNTIATMDINRSSAAGTYETAEFQIATATELIVTGYTSGNGANQSADVDYVVLIKTGEAEAPAKVEIKDMSLTVAEGEQIDEDGDFKVTFNYKGIINDESVMPSGSFKISVYDADNNPIVEGEPWTFTFSAGSKNVYVSDLEGGKEYTIKVDEVVVKDNSKIDYETVFTGEEILKITEGLPSLKFTPIAAEVAPVEVKDMKMTYDKNELIDEEGDYQVTFNYTGKINDETIKPEDLYSVIKYQVYDEDYNLAASGTRDFDITAGSRNVYVSGLTAGKTYQFMVTGLVVMNGETEVLNLTSGLPKLTFKVKDPNAPQAITMSNMSFTVAEGEKIDEDGDFKVTFNYTATINDASAVNYPFATVTYEVTDENGEKVGGTVAQFSIEETSKNLYISNLVEGKSYTITATKIEIQDFVTMEMLCETEKDLPTLTFTAGEAPVPAVAELTADMFKQWDSYGANPTATGAGYGECHWGESTGLPYGNGSVIGNLYADLTPYAVLQLIVTEGTPRLLLNRQSMDGTSPDFIEINSATSPYVSSVENGVWNIDIAKIVAEKGYAHLNCIKGANWANTTITSAMLYVNPEDAPTGINNATINAAKANGKFVENGKIVIVKNGKKYSVNGYQMK